MKLFIITLPHFFDGECHLINRLFEEGLQCLHLRKPAADLSSLRILIEGIKTEFRERVALHYYEEIAREYQLKGLHLSEAQRMEADQGSLAKLKTEGFILSTSVHQEDQLPELSRHFSYAFFSPVFDSISKEGYSSSISPGFKLDATQKPVEVIALGGVNLNNINKVKEMNFDGIAILGALWAGQSDVPTNFSLFKKATS